MPIHWLQRRALRRDASQAESRAQRLRTAAAHIAAAHRRRARDRTLALRAEGSAVGFQLNWYKVKDYGF